MALKAFPFQPTAEERKPPWPVFCRRCGQLIAPDGPARRCYRGFLYHEHVECPPPARIQDFTVLNRRGSQRLTSVMVKPGNSIGSVITVPRGARSKRSA
jgi:hypothetical protein